MSTLQTLPFDEVALGQLRLLSGQVLEMFFECKKEESTQSFVQFLLQNDLPDGTQIGWFLERTNMRDAVLKRQVLLAFAEWINRRLRSLDAMLRATMSCGSNGADSVDANNKLIQYMQTLPCQSRKTSERSEASEFFDQVLKGSLINSSREEQLLFLKDFLFFVVLQLLGAEFSCFASALAALVVSDHEEECANLIKDPVQLLSYMVKELEHCRSKAATVALDLAVHKRRSSLVMQFCRYFSVDFDAWTLRMDYLQVHENNGSEAWQQSPFSIVLVDSYGRLMELLLIIESNYSDQMIIAVDFEGVKLNRSGQLCLVQLTCSHMPSRVYVLDVFVLPQALHFATPNGLSIKSILEDITIQKIWFDPRNDVDALYHQFGIVVQRIFDLQLAEVAVRRSKGFQVKYVLSLQKCLAACDRLEQTQKNFAEFINKCGKQLFEPDFGGSYEIFRNRPLLDHILIYAAHDSRYMLLLYSCYSEALTDAWNQRVRAASHQRAQWYMHPTYVRPTTDAPDLWKGVSAVGVWAQGDILKFLDKMHYISLLDFLAVICELLSLT